MRACALMTSTVLFLMAPAAYADCDGADPGDECTTPEGASGICMQEDSRDGTGEVYCYAEPTDSTDTGDATDVADPPDGDTLPCPKAGDSGACDPNGMESGCGSDTCYAPPECGDSTVGVCVSGCYEVGDGNTPNCGSGYGCLETETVEICVPQGGYAKAGSGDPVGTDSTDSPSGTDGTGGGTDGASGTSGTGGTGGTGNEAKKDDETAAVACSAGRSGTGTGAALTLLLLALVALGARRVTA